MKREMLHSSKTYSHLLLAVEIIWFSLPLILSGCATTRKQADGQGTYEKIPFSEILKSPEQYKGKAVRLGGVIINTQNREKETILEILEKPLTWRGRPKPGDVSSGRFMVVFERFLDQAIYRPNRPVTIIGEITGIETAPIGEAAYDYPLLSGKEIRLWEQGSHFGRPRLRIGIGVGGGNVGVGLGTSF